ncbi:uncharacterized protein LOC110456206 [Mizuhopecten yessoensis]|uniref:Uncharacterized protein n=1 Tax=Mizuhopecten yessoensis TaxID=6573 RepID=A0A210QBG8_MIZYE|nr:uncharacterized protein LOC110456206 [Mizuhopecten yessoensis]OWF46083.1 hypothetical protein KP79_PYT01465 [Mizuhopecten yessoensis]
MKGGTICVVVLVLTLTLIEGKKAKHRQTRAAEELEDLQLNNNLVRTKRKSEGQALSRMKRLHEPETELKRMKRTKRSLSYIHRPQISERALSRRKRVPMEAVLHRAKRVRADKTLRRIKRLRRDLRTELMRHRRNTKELGNNLRIPIMKRDHRTRMRPDKRSQARLSRMKAVIGNHIQQRKRNRVMHHRSNGPAHKKNDVIHKKNHVAQRRVIMNKTNKHHLNKVQAANDKKHHVQGHAN